MKSSPSHKVWTLFTAALKWVQHVPMFANLDICEQYSMLRCCWSDLFILIAAQYDLQIDSVALAYEIDTCTGMCNERKLRLKQTLANFHECLLRLRGLEEAEYACLRVMVLFSSGEECKPNQPETKVSEIYILGFFLPFSCLLSFLFELRPRTNIIYNYGPQKFWIIIRLPLP